MTISFIIPSRGTVYKSPPPTIPPLPSDWTWVADIIIPDRPALCIFYTKTGVIQIQKEGSTWDHKTIYHIPNLDNPIRIGESK